MNKTRLEAFSDAVIAIIMTIMVLELKIPHGAAIEDLAPLVPTFLAYVLSFVYLGIYWNNHHHMLQATHSVSGAVLWANLNLLFWLSLLPFATAWMGENHFSPTPTAVYGFLLLMCALAYMFLQHKLISHTRGENRALAEVLGSDLKGKISPILYILAIPLAFVNQHISHAIFALVAIIWFIPDSRIEKRFAKGSGDAEA